MESVESAPAANPASTPTTTATTAPDTTITETKATETLFSPEKTPEKTSDRPEYLHEKYKTVEDQAKAYTDLHKMYLEKNDVPEKYDFKEIFEKHGMQVADETQYASFEKELKDAGISHRQASVLLERYASEVQTLIKPYNDKIAELTPPNLFQEKEKLQAEWGDKTTDNLAAAGKWARSNLPKDVAEALGRSANGIKFVTQMMNGQRGPVPIVDHTGPTALDPGEMEAKIKDIMTQPDYKRNDAKGKQLQKEVYTLHKQLRQIRGQPLTT